MYYETHGFLFYSVFARFVFSFVFPSDLPSNVVVVVVVVVVVAAADVLAKNKKKRKKSAWLYPVSKFNF